MLLNVAPALKDVTPFIVTVSAASDPNVTLPLADTSATDKVPVNTPSAIVLLVNVCEAPSVTNVSAAFSRPLEGKI